MSKRSKRKNQVPKTSKAKALFEWARPPGGFVVPGAILVFVVSFVVYLLTMPHDVIFEDSGLFSLACYQISPAHPPGYPLYSMLCALFAHFPFLATPHWLGILSALLASSACVVLYFFASHLLSHTLYGILAALSYAFSRLFWSQAIIPEVYSLNALLFFVLLLLALVWRRTHRAEVLGWGALAFGLSLSNHWPLILLSSPALLIFMLGDGGGKVLVNQLAQSGRLLRVLGLFVLGLIPYFFLYLRSDMPLVNLFGGLRDFSNFVDYILRESYSGIDHQSGVVWQDRMLFIQFLADDFLRQYGLLAVAPILAGFVYQWKKWGTSTSVALVVLWVMSSLLLVFLVDFKYNALWYSVFRVYPSIAYVSLALWLALGVCWMSGWLLPYAKKIVQRTAITRGIGAVAVALIVASIAYTSYPFNRLNDDYLARFYSETILQSLPKDAYFFILVGDYHLPLLVAHTIDGVRPDVKMYSKLGNPLRVGDRPLNLAQTMRTTERPMYYTNNLSHPYGVEDFGIYKKVRKDLPQGKIVYTLPANAIPLLDAINQHTKAESDPHPWYLYFAKSIKERLLLVISKGGVGESELAQQIRARI